MSTRSTTSRGCGWTMARKCLLTTLRLAANTGSGESTQRVMKSPWDFVQYGQSGRWVSELFPATARHVDDLCFLHGMHTEGVAHGPATLFLHCGATQLIRPSMGSWILYGLGSESEDLPGFVTICPSAGNGGAQLWHRISARRIPRNGHRPSRHASRAGQSAKSVAAGRCRRGRAPTARSSPSIEYLAAPAPSSRFRARGSNPVIRARLAHAASRSPHP